jgi:hypothetical protein
MSANEQSAFTALHLWQRTGASSVTGSRISQRVLALLHVVQDLIGFARFWWIKEGGDMDSP